VYKVHHGELAADGETPAISSRTPAARVRHADSYEPLVGELLHEKHPSREFTHQDQWVAYPRWTLCWSALELYEPKSAEQLAALRISRERGKTEREEKKWAEQNPLLVWAGPSAVIRLRSNIGPCPKTHCRARFTPCFSRHRPAARQCRSWRLIVSAYSAIAGRALEWQRTEGREVVLLGEDPDAVRGGRRRRRLPRLV